MNEYKKRCSGCMACISVCPVGCICIKTDSRGDFVRIIDKNKCRQCNQCDKICPVTNIGNLRMPKKAYTAWSKKRNVNRKSASGGVAASIYEYCLQNGIKCIGVKWDKNFKAKYDFVPNIKAIEKFASSKYVHSCMGGIYEQVLKCLERGEKIVFVGLPCHVAALQNVTAGKNNNLLCVDLVCHGVAAEKFFTEHIDHMLENKINRSDIVSIDFREEKNPYGITIKGKMGGVLKRQSREKDEYMLGYCRGFTYCEECYRCRYARKERCSDLTIKDFCGTRTGILSKQRHGLSSILVNSSKGELFIEELEEYLNIVDYSVSKVIAEDTMLRRPPSFNWKRRIFLKLYPILGFDLTVRILCFDAFFKNKIECENMSEKHFVLFLLMNEWMKTKQEGKHIKEYFEKNQYKSIAIYGLSYVGERLLDELKGCGLEVKYGIDKKIDSDSICMNVDVYSPENELPEVDIIVVTAVYFFDEIRDKLSEKVDCPIVSLEDILYEIS